MRLTRRDALAALASITAASAGCVAPSGDDPVPPLSGTERETVVATAEVLYPSAVSGIDEFVETYLDRRAASRERRAGIREAVALVDDRARDWFGAPFRDLDPDTRDSVLRQASLDVQEPDPDGVAEERARFYLVNDLLYALYASPTGGRLAGIENPQGFPGGTRSYRQGPEAVDAAVSGDPGGSTESDAGDGSSGSNGNDGVGGSPGSNGNDGVGGSANSTRRGGGGASGDSTGRDGGGRA